MNKRISVFCYRAWAIGVVSETVTKFKNTYFEIYIPHTKLPSEEILDLNKINNADVHFIRESSNEEIYNNISTELNLFIGWSWIIPSHFVSEKICICFHPSNLPSYRGGSPIQNQVFDGLIESRLTVFKMTDFLDHGPIFKKYNLSLNGDINDIFYSLKEASKNGFNDIVSDYTNSSLIFKDAENISTPIHKRRKPADSIFLLKDLKKYDSKHLIRCIGVLLDPYPNFTIRLHNLSLRIQLARELSGYNNNEHYILYDDIKCIERNKTPIIKTKTGYLALVKFIEDDK